MRYRILVDGEAHDVEVEGSPPAVTVRVDGEPYRTRVSASADGFEVRIGSRRHRIALASGRVVVDGREHEVAAEPMTGGETPSPAPGRHGAGTAIEIRPPMPGRIVKLSVSPGDSVKRGQTLAVLEAMKMQNEIPAPQDSVVRTVTVREGETIAGDRVIAVLEVR